MTPKCWITWVLFSGLLWNLTASKGKRKIDDELKKCLEEETKIFFVADTFNLFTMATNGSRTKPTTGEQLEACILFMKENATLNETSRKRPQMAKKDSSHLLLLSKWFSRMNGTVHVVRGKNCCSAISNFTASNHPKEGPCRVRRVCAKDLCEKAVYNKTQCNRIAPRVNNKYIINVTATNYSCYNCDKPQKDPDENIEMEEPPPGEDNTTTADAASKTMENVVGYASSMNGSSAAVSGGKDVEGAIVKIEDAEAYSFAYDSPNDGMSIISDSNYLSSFSRSVSVSKEAIDKALKANLSVPFIAIIRFTNLAQDEQNSTVLGNEVLGVEMGTAISNLTDGIGINFRNMTYKGIPSCQSWNGKGNRPSWTDEGCLTLKNGSNITCQCSHLTFFAILLAPLNETISSADLNNLTIITKVGCGVSMFFLCIVLFMYFLIRKTKATDSTRILIQLVLSMFLLNLLFLINNFVADLKNSVGCKIVAALMHYFMLATFTWFAVQAFHLCLQLYTKGNMVIKRYMLKVCITTWLTPSVIVAILLILGKYDLQVIHTDNATDNVNMCWINDPNVHYIVNIGYYAFVFLFTFSTFTIMLSWLCILKRTKKIDEQVNKNGISLMTVMGLCCLLGVTWGFAFFAYGPLRIPSYYIFTVLNSFQGFFLFIYYYKSRSSPAANTSTSDNSSSNASRATTVANDVLGFDNPYSNMPAK